MIIRDVKKEELGTLWNLIKEKSFELDYKELEELHEKSESMIAFEDINIGFASIRFLYNEDGKDEYDISIFINPKFRLNGYGTLLVNHLENSMKKDSSQLLRIDNMLKYYDASEFLGKIEYGMWFSSSLMTYQGGILEYPQMDLIPYEDKYFKSYVQLLNEAFYQISVENNLSTKPIPMTEKFRNELISTSHEFSLLINKDELIGVVQVTDDHVTRAMVSESARGKGYGGSLIKFATNKILNNRLEPKLFIMDTNIGARKLYESIGYNLVSTVHVYRKAIWFLSSDTIYLFHQLESEIEVNDFKLRYSNTLMTYFFQKAPWGG